MYKAAKHVFEKERRVRRGLALFFWCVLGRNEKSGKSVVIFLEKKG